LPGSVQQKAQRTPLPDGQLHHKEGGDLFMEGTIAVQREKAPLLNNLLKLFMLAMILANTAGQMYGPLLPLYLKSLNASVVQVGLFFTLSQIIPLALQILGGWVSDCMGRLRSIAIGSLAGVLSYVGLILAPTWQWVLLGEGFGAVTRSLVGPSFGAFIAEQSAEENRARVFAFSEMIYSVVVIIGPPLGGWLVDQYGFKFMLICAGALYTLATAIRVGMARAAARGHEANPQPLTFSTLRSNLGLMFGLIAAGGLITWMLIVDGVRDVGFTMSFTLMPLYLNGIGNLNMQQIGWLSSVFGITNMIVAIPAGWLADKKGERLVIASGFLLNAAAIFIFMEATSFWGYASSWAVFGIGVGIMSPAYSSLISKAIPENVRGTGFGLMHTSLGIFSLPAPAIGAQLYQYAGPRVPFVITAWIMIVSIIPIWLKFRLPKSGTDKQKSAD
jgi:MFS family permease